MIENQIREKESVHTYSAEDRAYMISSHSAAQFVLQTLVEATKRPSGEVVFVCDAGEPISLAEVATKLASFYGIELGQESSTEGTGTFNKPAPLSEIVSPRLEDTYHKNVKVLKEDEKLSSENIQITLRDLVIGSNSELSAEDWKIKTKLILDLCGPRMFGSQ
jgi:hypothetical protein